MNPRSTMEPNARVAARAAVKFDPWKRLPPLPELTREYAETYLSADAAAGTLAQARVVLLKLGGGTDRRGRHHVAEVPPKPTTLELRKWLAGKIERKEMLPTTANKYVDIIRNMAALMCTNYEVAVLWRDLKKFTEQERRQRVLPKHGEGRDAAFERILLHMPGDLERAFLAVMRYQGLRKGEALGLEAHHVQFGATADESWLCVEQQRHPWSKNPTRLKTTSSFRTLPLDPRVLPYLRAAVSHLERRQHCDWEKSAAWKRFLFPFYAGTLDKLTKLMRDVMPDVFVKHANAFHVFRHTFASTLADAFDIKEIMPMLGHKDPRWTVRYVDGLRGKPVMPKLSKLVRGGGCTESTITTVNHHHVARVADGSGVIVELFGSKGGGGCSRRNTKGQVALPLPPFALSPRKSKKISQPKTGSAVDPAQTGPAAFALGNSPQRKQ